MQLAIQLAKAGPPNKRTVRLHEHAWQLSQQAAHLLERAAEE
jgi:hypothetical protein